MNFQGTIRKKGKFYVYDGKESEKNRIYARGFGIIKKKELILTKEEALFLHEMYNIKAENIFDKQDFTKYIALRELFIRGYKIVKEDGKDEIKNEENFSRNPLKVYKKYETKINVKKAKVISQDKQFLIVDSDKRLYSLYWFGQYGVYKKDYGKLFFLDQYEAYYLKEKGLLEGEIKVTYKFFDEIYRIYKEWRDAGYVLKSGFKFGGDFRLYMPNAMPNKKFHSKHILHVFPKGLFLRAEDWSKAIRTCHSVKKTYILAIPKEKEKIRNFKPDALVSKENETFVVKVLRQDDYVKGHLLASALEFCINKHLPLLLCFVDRDTATTFYRADRIILEGSDNVYYEVSWIRF